MLGDMSHHEIARKVFDIIENYGEKDYYTEEKKKSNTYIMDL